MAQIAQQDNIVVKTTATAEQIAELATYDAEAAKELRKKYVHGALHDCILEYVDGESTARTKVLGSTNTGDGLSVLVGDVYSCTLVAVDCGEVVEEDFIDDTPSPDIEE